MTQTSSPDVGAADMPDPPGWRHRWLEVNGARMHVAELGEGPAVLLVHGFPQHWYAWRRVAAELADDHRVVVPDLRGFGWSDAPAHGYDSRTQVDDLIALMDRLGLDDVALGGHEWGAWAGFMLCLRVPDRVRGFVAVNVPHPWPLHRRLAPAAWRFWYTALLEAPLVGRVVLRRWPAFTRFLLRRGSADPSDQAVFEGYADLLRDPARARAGEKWHRALVVHDIRALAMNGFRRQTLQVRTTLLAGTSDVVVPPRAVTGVHPRQPRLTVRLVEGGHFLHEEVPTVVADAVRRT